jgi:hypothetical protein
MLIASVELQAAGRISWNSNGTLLGFGGSHVGVEGIYQFDVSTSSLSYVGSHGSMNHVSFSSDSALLSVDGLSIGVWTSTDHQRLFWLEDVPAECWLDFAPGSHELLRACLTRGVDPFYTELAQWDWAAANPRRIITETEGIFRSLATNGAGDKAILSLARVGPGLDDWVKVIDLADGTEICRVTGFHFALALAVDQFAVLPIDGPIRRYYIDACAELEPAVSTENSSTWTIPFTISADGALLFLGVHERSAIRVVEAETAAVIFEGLKEPSQIYELAASPVGSMLAVVRRIAVEEVSVEIYAYY